MDKRSGPPTYGFVTQPQAPPSYEQAVGQAPMGIPPQPSSNTVPGVHTEQPTVVTQVIITQVGPHSTHMSCPSCHADIKTNTKSTPGTIAYVSGFLIALFGCWLGCCLIPCCIDECMETHHYCPNCNAYLGRYGR